MVGFEVTPEGCGMPEDQRACLGNVGVKTELLGIERIGFGVAVFPNFVRVLVYGEMYIEIERSGRG